ncbi:aluminum-activated malate transporter 7-like [Impatiens glandulifera]|uniref:aluminum-activated malate transporter 7-like n=1 Tax=Impatiens glandulifera TaxID=253017 RepID=UPI001FB15693|nr:aluminum-activated malate transporter 7-like [Impatiens glandulifera]
MGCVLHEYSGHAEKGWSCLNAAMESWLMCSVKLAKKVGKDDPRRVTHSVKVGMAVVFASLFYYLHPVYNSYSVDTIWTLITVVVVLEFSVGATIGKGLNRRLATLISGVLVVGAHFLATISGQVGHPILIAILVFLQGAVFTFLRFFPNLKVAYDYGLSISILTFSMVSVSGFHSDQVIDIALKRLSTILIGIVISFATSIIFFPVWAGQDLHDLLVLNMEKLATLLQYLLSDNIIDCDYTSIIINSRIQEENFANFERWEPAHGKFMFSHPWKTYLSLGNLTRECAYQIEVALIKNNTYKIDEAAGTVVGRVQETCRELSVECSKAIMTLSLAMKTMTKPCLADLHVAMSRNTSQRLQILLKETDHMNNNNDIIIATLPLLQIMC